MLPLEERWYRRLLLLALILGAVGGLSALIYDSATGRGVSLLFGSPTSDPWTGRWWWIPLVSAGAVLVVYLRRRTRTSGPVPGASASLLTRRMRPSSSPLDLNSCRMPLQARQISDHCWKKPM